MEAPVIRAKAPLAFAATFIGAGVVGMLTGHMIKILNPATQLTPWGCAVGFALALPFAAVTATVATLAVAAFSKKRLEKTFKAVFLISAVTYARAFSLIQSSTTSMSLQMPSSTPWYAVTLLMVLGTLSLLAIRRRQMRRSMADA